jgi:hypothetical protein
MRSGWESVALIRVHLPILTILEQRLVSTFFLIDTASHSLSLTVILNPEKLKNVANHENNNKYQVECFQ